jgi:ferric-dicitrate binding protein FerR (iron transport regulator)
MDEKQLISLIGKYLSHQCSEEEKAIVEQWYETLGEEQPAFLNGDAQKIKGSTERSLKVIQEKLAAGNPEAGPLMLPVKRSNSRLVRIAAWAAAACILLCISVFVRFYLKSARAPERYIVLSTGIKEIKNWTLPDGSVVWLNAGSSIRLPADFNERKRDVYLEGEAFFDVAREANKPFIIHSGKLNTRVLGTAFAISAYPDAALNTISVLQGEVQVSDGLQVLGNLVADKKMEYRNASGEALTADVDAEKDMAWKTRQLAFTNLPMSDIAIHLQRWYGYHFYFKDQRLKSVRFTAGFRNDISLSDLLKLMQEVSHVNYQLDHKAKTVTFL